MVPGLTAVNTAYDYMHSKFLGVDMVTFGSVFFLLCFHILPQSPKQNLQECWKFILKFYKEHKIVERYRGMSKLTLFMKKKGGPKLKGRASQVQNVAAPLQALWAKHMNPHVETHRKIATLLKVNVAMDKLMKANQHSLAFPAADAAKFKSLGFAAAQLHRDLSQHFAQDEEISQTLFSDIPKLHAMLHSVLSCDYLNPRLTWCFRQEDSMNLHRTLVRSCCRGLQGPQATVKMLAKLRIALHLQLTKM